MQSLLDALKDGRLVELPDNDKEKALQYLAHLIEAIPEIGGGVDLEEDVCKREKASNTGIGLGVACPHVRVPRNGNLLCAVGWSPAGVNYGAMDNEHVHLIFMYYIPDSAKTAYLREISFLAMAIKKEQGIHAIAHAEDIATVRERLLDWVSAAIESEIPGTKARMIRLEMRQAVLDSGAQAVTSTQQIFPVLILSQTEDEQIVLCENREIVTLLEADNALGLILKQRAQFDRGTFRFVYRTALLYDPTRPLYEYLAIKIG